MVTLTGSNNSQFKIDLNNTHPFDAANNIQI